MTTVFICRFYCTSLALEWKNSNFKIVFLILKMQIKKLIFFKIASILHLLINSSYPWGVKLSFISFSCTEFLKGSWLTDDSRRMAMKKTTTSHYFTKLMHFSDFYKQKKGGGAGGCIFSKTVICIEDFKKCGRRQSYF